MILYVTTFLANGGYECGLAALLLGAVLFTSGGLHRDLRKAASGDLVLETAARIAARRKRVVGK